MVSTLSIGNKRRQKDRSGTEGAGRCRGQKSKKAQGLQGRRDRRRREVQGRREAEGGRRSSAEEREDSKRQKRRQALQITGGGSF